MNAAFLLMSSAALAGADPAPAAPAAPAVISTGHGCNNCGAPAACCPKPGLLDKIKARIGAMKHKAHHCDCAPAPAPAPCDPCAKGAAHRPNLLDKLKARFAGKKHSCGCDPCAGAPAHHAPAPGGTAPPKEMPKPKDPPKADPKPKGNVSIPAPLPAVAGATGTSPY